MPMRFEHSPDRPATSGFQSVRVKVFGRFMLRDHTEHECQVSEMSPGTAKLRSDSVAGAGERIIAYIDHLGRVEGEVIESLDDGFVMSIQASDRKRERLAAQLTWLANRHELNLPEDRRHERMQPSNPVSILRTLEGGQFHCRIVDLSLSGAAIEVDLQPPIGTEVTLGAMRGRVVRKFEGGIAIEFSTVQAPGSLQESLVPH